MQLYVFFNIYCNADLRCYMREINHSKEKPANGLCGLSYACNSEERKLLVKESAYVCRDCERSALAVRVSHSPRGCFLFGSF
jgi:hypothetical protein